MNTTHSKFQVEVWHTGRQCWLTTSEVDTFDLAQRIMTASIPHTGDKARVVEVRTVVTRERVATAKNLGTTEDEIVNAVTNHEGGF